MGYQYEFDETSAGDLCVSRPDYELIQEAYRSLKSELEIWNKKALEHGAESPPYSKELNVVELRIRWGEKELAKKNNDDVLVSGISAGSLRYAKAGIILLLKRQEAKIAMLKDQGWPSAALEALNRKNERLNELAENFKVEPAEILWELIGRPEDMGEDMIWDCFICHASEDKDEIARPLAEELAKLGLNVWFDEGMLKVGDSLRRTIDRGLAHSKFGIVVISHNLLAKEWPQKELDGLVAREANGKKVILPVWHKITVDEIRSHSPMLADRMATNTARGLKKVVEDITSAMS